jgi:alpha-L-rhamnosidase
LAPQPDYRLKYANASLDSAAGLYESKWELREDGQLKFEFVIPFNTSAKVELPDAKLENVFLNGSTLKEEGMNANQIGEKVFVTLTSGTWEFSYMPAIDYIKYCNTHMPFGELLGNKDSRNVLEETFPQAAAFPQEMVEKVGHQSLRELSHMPFLPISSEVLDELDGKLKKIKVVIQ